ncbi:UNVERIFIED_CONTAM: hypothetical protein KB574_09635 [Streptococcus canis]|uniref:Lipoprotein n=1 Tax=Streptococcus canis TaxID=1329 RepID=A0AAE4TQ76_STRCB|nr:hypothetical protein [Streptococcus canis]MDV5977715.1 hypothetical protein [Streptococcus canis]MDW7798721.1 hypothetical protein [Streptococcus canis]
MKKTFLMTITLLSIVALGACSEKNADHNNGQKQSALTKNPVSSNSMEVKNGILKKVGQWTIDDTLGKVKLLKITEKPKNIEITNGLSTTIKNVKLLHASDIKELNNALLHTDQKSGNYIQITASVTNDTDIEYGGIYPEVIVLSDGTQIRHNHSFNSETDVKPHAKVDEMLFFYFIGEKETDSLKLYYDSIYDNEGNGIGDIKAEETILFN